jgi:hypothetical protein
MNRKKGFSGTGSVLGGPLFNGDPQTFNSSNLSDVEDLNDSLEEHALVGPYDHGPRFVEGNERFQFRLQLTGGLGLVIEEEFISTINGDNNGFFLLNRRFDISLWEFDKDPGFPVRIEGVDQAESREKEDKDVEDDVGERDRFQSDH